MKRMMRAGFLICLLLISLVSCKQKQYNEALDLIEQGEIEAAFDMLGEMGDDRKAQELLTHFRYVPTKIVFYYGEERAVRTYTYDEHSLLEQIVVSAPDSIYYTEHFVYDADGRMISQSQKNVFEMTTVKEDYTYDENGNLSSMVSIASDGSVHHRYEYTYDKNGNLICETYENILGESKTVDYTYDTDGRLLRIAHTGDFSAAIEEYTYDAGGNMVRHIYVDDIDGETVKSCTYDANGNLIQEVEVYPDGGTWLRDYRYDTNGNMLRMVITYPDGDISTTEYTYDVEGRLLLSKTTHPNGGIGTYEYTYDAHGNKMKQVYTSQRGSTESYEYEYQLVYIPFILSEKTEEMWNIEWFHGK